MALAFLKKMIGLDKNRDIIECIKNYMRISRMKVAQTTDSSFRNDVLNHQGYVLVDFWAEWCGPCRAVGPVLDSLSETFGENLKIMKVNIDENPDTPVRYGVRSIPTLVLFKDGQVVKTQVGALPKPALEEWIRQTL